MAPVAVYLIVRLVAPDGSVGQTFVTYDPTMTIERCEAAAQRMQKMVPSRPELRIVATCQQDDPTKRKGREVET